jgi:hypothetical protein
MEQVTFHLLNIIKSGKQSCFCFMQNPGCIPVFRSQAQNRAAGGQVFEKFPGKDHL